MKGKQFEVVAKLAAHSNEASIEIPVGNLFFTDGDPRTALCLGLHYHILGLRNFRENHD